MIGFFGSAVGCYHLVMESGTDGRRMKRRKLAVNNFQYGRCYHPMADAERSIGILILSSPPPFLVFKSKLLHSPLATDMIIPLDPQTFLSDVYKGRRIE